MNVSKNFLKTMFLCGLMFLNNAFASCDRSDVEYYLGNGFNPDQITKICTKEQKLDSEVQRPSNTGVATQQRNSTTQQENRDTRQESSDTGQENRPQSDTEFLMSSIDGNNIQFYDDKLSFEQRKCVVYTNKVESIDSPKTYCSDIRTTIYLSNLNILKTKGIKYFSSSRKSSFSVKGNIDIEVLDIERFNSSLKSNQRSFALKKMNVQPIKIPLLRGVAPADAIAKLTKLVK